MSWSSRDAWAQGLLAAVVLGLAVGLGTSAGAFAPQSGGPEPTIEVLTQSTPWVTWLVSVRLTSDGRKPLRQSVVRVVPSMEEPHRMFLPGVSLAESPHLPGLYSGPVTFPHPGRWTLEVEALAPSGTTRRRFEVEVTHASGQAAAPQVLPSGAEPFGSAAPTPPSRVRWLGTALLIPLIAAAVTVALLLRSWRRRR